MIDIVRFFCYNNRRSEFVPDESDTKGNFDEYNKRKEKIAKRMEQLSA